MLLLLLIVLLVTIPLLVLFSSSHPRLVGVTKGTFDLFILSRQDGTKINLSNPSIDLTLDNGESRTVRNVPIIWYFVQTYASNWIRVNGEAQIDVQNVQKGNLVGNAQIITSGQCNGISQIRPNPLPAIIDDNCWFYFNFPVF